MLASNDPPLKRLYVSGIAEDQNNIQMLSDYFKQYGVISEVIIGYHGNPDVALVSFASHEEARAAFDDDQAVLGNPDIQVRWVVKGKKSVSEPSTSSSSTSSSSSPSKPSPNLTNQCQKCSKILASKHSLSNHMRQMHAEFNCPACHTVFESANEFRKHYNAEHSNGFVPRPMDSKDFFRANSNSTMNIDLTETLTTMRHKNASLVKKLKKYKKDKSKTAKNLQKQLVKLLEERCAHKVEMDTMRQKMTDVMQKLDDEQKASLAKEATLTTMEVNFNRLQQEKTQLTQNLLNEQMKVEMLRNTMSSLLYRHR